MPKFKVTGEWYYQFGDDIDEIIECDHEDDVYDYISDNLDIRDGEINIDIDIEELDDEEE